jgi:UDP-N-acetylglucosamine--dolichyl-phosphate N-acetylglucosaminephosphotransferase
MPRLNQTTGLLEYSNALFTKPPNQITRVILSAMEKLLLVSVKRLKDGKIESCSNLTLINLVLVRIGPMREDVCVRYIAAIQSFCSILAFFIRYGFWWIW